MPRFQFSLARLLVAMGLLVLVIVLWPTVFTVLAICLVGAAGGMLLGGIRGAASGFILSFAAIFILVLIGYVVS